MDKAVRREWLEDEATQEVIEELEKRINLAAARVFNAAETGTLDEIRKAVFERKALYVALRAIKGTDNEKD